MLGKNNSYFGRELCQDGHYIVTGYTNDQFCNDMLQITDITYEMHHYLRHAQGFDGVIFFERGADSMLYCYDQQSFDILLGGEAAANKGASSASGGGPLGPMGAARGSRSREQNNRLHMCRQEVALGWNQVTALLKENQHRVAVVFSNMDTLLRSLGETELATLESLSSYAYRSGSIVIYIFKETSSSGLLNSVEHSRGGATGPWADFMRNVLYSRIAGSPADNRVISLGTPNQIEILNLLNYMRVCPKEEMKLKVDKKDIKVIAERLAASCARKNKGLIYLLIRLEECIKENPTWRLSAGNWGEVTGESGYLDPMEQLEQMIVSEDESEAKSMDGLKALKANIERWKAKQSKNKTNHGKPSHYSRLSPPPSGGIASGHELNMILKGNPGTGKKTIARLMGRIYYELSLLPTGQLIECSAADLISSYVGDTALRVSARVQEALGGVLFIKEAYALTDNQHGIEAIDQLTNDLSEYKGRFAVILAGYPAEMDRFLQEGNKGLEGFFKGQQYTLQDYSAEEMRRIFERMVRNDSERVAIGSDLAEALPNFCEAWVGGATRRGWGNAGEAEILLSEMKKRCSLRMGAEENESGIMELSTRDIPENLRHCLVSKSRSDQEALDEIDKMIGLTNVKKFLRTLRDNIVLGMEERAPGNYIFLGAPGTGKTTVARRMGELLGHLGILRRKVNNVIECRAADLLNRSARLTELVADARGGILFIDEAHQLEQDERGHSIIRELVPLIEDPEIHADTCFICAGYTAEMKRFLEVDQGLSRRFPLNNRIRFDDYTALELIQILEKMASDRGEITDGPEFQAYLSRSKAALEKFLERPPENFGNGGYIRDFYLPESIKARTERLVAKYCSEEGGLISREKAESIDGAEKKTLTEEDIPKSFQRLAGPVGKHSKERNMEALLSELYGKTEFVEYVESLFVKEDEELYFDGRADAGMHYSIAGPDGSGRHLAARTMAHAMKELGLLESDHVKFVGKSDLEAGYVGQTAIKTQNVIEQAVGGTLVVTYPSAMLPKSISDNSFGPEALGVIMGAMSEHFHDLCVVFLDTADGMEDFLKACPSVRSHLCRQFAFDDLGHEDMLNVFRLKTKDSMVFEESAEVLLSDFFLNWVSHRGGLGEAAASWGNGKEVDRLINELIQNWKNAGGTSRTEEVQEGDSVCVLKRRYVTREMFPKSLSKYLTSSRVASEDALQKLESMTGLGSVKESIRQIERRLKINKEGTVIPGTYCYIGNPGVGKTSVAKLMGGFLKAAGALKQGHVIIRTARQMSDNVGDFDKIVKLARNGILFIDEAHQLAELTNVNGRSVIKKLLTVFEDEEIMKDTCIILAGYPRDMEILFEADSGLKSRLEDNIIPFDDYTAEELLEILGHMALHADSIARIGVPFPLRLSKEYKERSLEVFQDIINKGNSDYGNARFARNFLHDSVDALLERVEGEYGDVKNAPGEVVDYLTEWDIPKRYQGIFTKR